MAPSPLEPVPDIPGVLSNGELRNLGLGLLRGTDLVSAHTETIKDIERILEEYDVFKGQLKDIPVPDIPIPRYAPLPVRDAWICMLCESAKKNACRVFVTEKNSRRTHFSEVHGELPARHRNEHVRACRVQTYCSNYNLNSRLFEVFESLQAVIAPDEPFVTRPASAEELKMTLLAAYSPADLPVTTGDSLKTTAPLLYLTKWASHVEKYGAARLRALTAPPGHPTELFSKLREEAMKVFFQDQREVIPGNEILRRQFVDEGTGNVSHSSLDTLTKAAAEDYSQSFARWTVFAMRCYELQRSGDNWYPVMLTVKQLRACELVYDWCHNRSQLGVRYLLLRMARAFWLDCPSDKAYEHLNRDALDDVTGRYTVLVNMKEDGTFMSPRNATHQIAMIKYFIRQQALCWVLDRSKDTPEISVQQLIDEVLPTLSANRVTPFGHLCLTMRHATRYANTTTSAPRVLWTDDNTIAVDGYQICFDDFRAMMARLLAHTEDLVLQHLFKGIDPALMGFNVTETTPIQDRFSETFHGYSFLTDPENPFGTMKLNLASAFFEYRSGFLAKGVHTLADGQWVVTWSDKDCDDWLRVYDECMECLLDLVHLVGGQPARGVETCVMKLLNGLHRVRSVYYIRPGMILFLLLYGKMSHTGKDTAVAHAVPWAIGRLYLMVVALARPLAGLLFERRSGSMARTIVESSAFTQNGEETTSKQLSDSIRRLFQTNLGANIGINACRHFLIGTQRKKMPEAYATIMRMLATVDTQGGHTTETAFDHYAIDPQELHLLNETTVLKSIHCSLRWASILFPDSVLLESERKGGGTESGRFLGIGVGAGDTDGESSGLYATLSLGDQLTKAVETALQNPSTLERLGRALSLGVPASMASNSRAMEWFSPSPRKTFAVEPKHLVLLRRFQNDPHAHWRSTTQAQAMAMVLSRSASCLIVMPTGAGKSLNFGPLPLIETGSTVVVFPLKAVMLDQVQSSQRRQATLARGPGASSSNVGMIEWTPVLESERGIHPPDALYAVTVETFGTQPFKNWLLGRVAERTLNRVVFDECHVALISRRYRGSMWSLVEMTQIAVPIVAMTATLPPSLEEQLRLMMGGPKWIVLREPTQRPNIEYHVARFGTETLAERALVRHVQRLEPQLEPGEGIMVICRTFPQVQKLGESLGAVVYDREQPREALKEILRRWTTGEVSTIVGTTALGTGVHHDRCRVVIHFLDPYGVIDYMQESGRVGRDGKPALSIVFSSLPHPELQSPEPPGHQVMMDLLDGVGCIRWVVSSWMDGRNAATTCSGGAGFRLCGRCQHALSKAVVRDGISLAGPDVPNCGSKAPLDGDAWVVTEIPRERVQFNDRKNDGRTKTIRPASTTASLRSTAEARVSDLEDFTMGDLETESASEVDLESSAMDWESSVLASSTAARGLGMPPSFGSGSTSQPASSYFSDSNSSLSSPNENTSSQPSRGSRVSHRAHFTVPINSTAMSNSAAALPRLRAVLPQPIGQAVMEDTRGARERARQAREPDSPNARVNPAQPFSIRVLIEAKKFMTTHCTYCVGAGLGNNGHPLSQCSQPERFRSFSMDGFTFKGQSWIQARSTGGKRRFSGQENICWLCLWPLGAFFEHPVRGKNESASKYCAAEDVLKQMAWAVVADERRRIAMRDYFSLREDVDMGSGTNYAEWAMTTHEPVSYGEDHAQSADLLNIHRVVIYILYIERRLLSMPRP